MVSPTWHEPGLKHSNTRQQMESWVLLLALACLLIARVWPALPLKTMAMMPMQTQMSASTDAAAALEDDIQSQHDCFDDALRCMGMMGGLCPLAQANCALVSTSHFVAPQVTSPLRSVDLVWSSLWLSVPKQPPRR